MILSSDYRGGPNNSNFPVGFAYCSGAALRETVALTGDDDGGVGVVFMDSDAIAAGIGGCYG